MSHILGMHEQMNLLIHRDRHLRRHDVVSGIYIMLGIEAKEVLRSLVDEFGMKRSELSVGAGVTEIESELSGLHLDGHGIGRRGSEIHVGPCLYAEDAESQDFEAHDQKRSNNQPRGADRKIFDLGGWAGVRELPDEKRQDELGGEKGDSSFRHGFRHLIIDQSSMCRNVLGRDPGMPQDGNRGKNRNYDDGDRKEFCHDASLPAIASDFATRI